MRDTILYAMDVTALGNAELYAAAYDRLPEERKRKTDGFRFEKDRLLSAGAGLLLQKALRELGVPEEKQLFTEGEHGKPRLTEYDDVFFNLSHAGTYVLCAVSDSEIGCDIEEIRPFRPELAKKIYSAAEYGDIAAGCSEDERAVRFFRYWTLRESYMKYTGLGLGLSLSRFELRRENGVSLLLDGKVQNVFFRETDELPGYAAAVCAGNELPPLCPEILSAAGCLG